MICNLQEHCVLLNISVGMLRGQMLMNFCMNLRHILWSQGIYSVVAKKKKKVVAAQAYIAHGFKK